MRHFLIAIDVGNSRVKLGVFHPSQPLAESALPKCLKSLAVRKDVQIPWQQLAEAIPAADDVSVTGMVAGPNPDGINRVLESWRPTGWPMPRIVDLPGDLPLEIRLDAPEKVGIDRLLGAVAANVVRPANRPALVVDCGTATTVNAVAADGAFEGGAILPGFELMARSLNQYTALLPLVTIDELSEQTPAPLGVDTHGALCSGLFWGQLGAVNEIMHQLSNRWTAELYLLLTGGGAGLLASHLPKAVWEPHLSLQGLAIVAEMQGPAS